MAGAAGMFRLDRRYVRNDKLFTASRAVPGFL
jgi:hypothetical protein